MELDTLIPQPISVNIGDDTLMLTPVTIGEIPRLLRVIRPFTGALLTDPDWLQILSEHGDAVLEALAICARKPRSWIDALALDDAVRLFEAVFEVNADFFSQRVAPLIQQIGHRVQQRLTNPPPPGVTSLRGSSGPATVTPTS